MIDARNLYETRIGHFRVETPSGTLQPMDPASRQFSDFARYIDSKVEDLNGRQVLMYCTGGVRCERASAYVRYALGRVGGSADVYQLSGGIHAYMEAYPEGGYFKGKNFVFDPRIAIPAKSRQKGTIDKTAAVATATTTASAVEAIASTAGAAATATAATPTAAAGTTPPGVADEDDDDDGVIGKCLLCESRFDDYSRQHRCGTCRMLVLVCDSCHATRQQQPQLQQQNEQQQHPQQEQQQQQQRQQRQQHSEPSSATLMCESCQGHQQ
jgi:predicted sulfurtransferase